MHDEEAQILIRKSIGKTHFLILRTIVLPRMMMWRHVVDVVCGGDTTTTTAALPDESEVRTSHLDLKSTK